MGFGLNVGLGLAQLGQRVGVLEGRVGSDAAMRARNALKALASLPPSGP